MFRVGVTRDFLKPDGTCGFGDIGLDELTSSGVEWEFLPAAGSEIPRVEGYDGLLVLGPAVTAKTVAGSELQIVARFGVGYDNVDVRACTENGVLLTICPDAVRRPVAAAALTFILALSHKLLIKDQLTRAGRWSEKLNYNGMGLTDRKLGIIGFGNIGRELAVLTKPLGMRIQATDPWVSDEAARAAGGDLLSLEELLRTSDFVCITCALTDATRHLVNAERLRLMKPGAYLINVARGAIVDQAALTKCLQEGRIAGAGLDVFDPEPIAATDPLLELDNVIVSPHAICWTDECFRLMGRSAVRSVLDVAAGRVPAHVVNREALAHSRLQHLAAQ